VRRAAVLALYLIACGRIAFDGRANGSASGDGAVDDGVQMMADAALDDDGATDDALFTCGDVTCSGTAAFTMCNGRCIAFCSAVLQQDIARIRCSSSCVTVLITPNITDATCATTLNPSSRKASSSCRW
jgi:hypothetical protein